MKASFEVRQHQHSINSESRIATYYKSAYKAAIERDYSARHLVYK